MIPLICLNALTFLISPVPGQPLASVSRYPAYAAPAAAPILESATNQEIPAAALLSWQSLPLLRHALYENSTTENLDHNSLNLLSDEETEISAESTSDVLEPFKLQSPRRTELKGPLLSVIPGNWQVTPAGDFIHALPNPGVELRVGYSDIFETGANPEKGGHGLSIRFQHSFGKHQ